MGACTHTYMRVYMCVYINKKLICYAYAQFFSDGQSLFLIYIYIYTERYLRHIFKKIKKS